LHNESVDQSESNQNGETPAFHFFCGASNHSVKISCLHLHAHNQHHLALCIFERLYISEPISWVSGNGVSSGICSLLVGLHFLYRKLQQLFLRRIVLVFSHCSVTTLDFSEGFGVQISSLRVEKHRNKKYSLNYRFFRRHERNNSQLTSDLQVYSRFWQ